MLKISCACCWVLTSSLFTYQSLMAPRGFVLRKPPETIPALGCWNKYVLLVSLCEPTQWLNLSNRLLSQIHQVLTDPEPYVAERMRCRCKTLKKIPQCFQTQSQFIKVDLNEIITVWNTIKAWCWCSEPADILTVLRFLTTPNIQLQWMLIQKFRQQPLPGPSCRCPSSKLGTVWYSDWGGRTAAPGESAAGSAPQSCSLGPDESAWPTGSGCFPGTGSQRCPSALPGRGGRTPRQLPGCSQNNVWHVGNAALAPDPRSALWPRWFTSLGYFDWFVSLWMEDIWRHIIYYQTNRIQIYLWDVLASVLSVACNIVLEVP